MNQSFWTRIISGVVLNEKAMIFNPISDHHGFDIYTLFDNILDALIITKNIQYKVKNQYLHLTAEKYK